MEKTKPVICVFCGSSYGADPQYAAAARALGRLIAERGFSLVFGGGGLGLMGETARAARDGGAPVPGVLPEFLRRIEQPPEWEKDLIITPDLQLRKTRMLAMADAFVVLPGGPGTMDEFFEVVTSAQLGVLAKPIVSSTQMGISIRCCSCWSTSSAKASHGPPCLATTRSSPPPNRRSMLSPSD